MKSTAEPGSDWLGNIIPDNLHFGDKGRLRQDVFALSAVYTEWKNNWVESSSADTHFSLGVICHQLPRMRNHLLGLDPADLFDVDGHAVDLRGDQILL